MDRQDIKNLKVRYSLWFYKTTKDALDRIERKFTQLDIDRIVLKELNKLDKNKKAKESVGQFTDYIKNKEKEGLNLKCLPDYHFLSLKLKALEKAIVKELGKKTLEGIKSLYEKEMTERILKSRGHK